MSRFLPRLLTLRTPTKHERAIPDCLAAHITCSIYKDHRIKSLITYVSLSFTTWRANHRRLVCSDRGSILCSTSLFSIRKRSYGRGISTSPVHVRACVG